MFPVNSVLARVLFDSGASHLFVTQLFVDKSGLQPTPLKDVMSVQIPGSITKANPWDLFPSQFDCVRNQRIGSSLRYGLDVPTLRNYRLCQKDHHHEE
jgi:hypothetical protein